MASRNVVILAQILAQTRQTSRFLRAIKAPVGAVQETLWKLLRLRKRVVVNRLPVSLELCLYRIVTRMSQSVSDSL
jgi:hypothetical protein